MTGGSVRAEKPSGATAAALYGAVIALVLGYGFSYFLSRLGAGMLGDAAARAQHGPAALARAGLNLCAMMRASLVGSGELPHAVDGVERVSAVIVLPLTVWAAIPAAALFIAGYAAARRRTGTGRWGTVLPALAAGVMFAGVLALLAPVFGATIASSALPAFGDVEFNPPDITFAPSAGSTLATGIAFGVVFTYLGALAALRADLRPDRSPGRWWAAGSAVVMFALVLQALVAGALAAWFLASSRSEDMGPESASRFLQMLPTAAGIAYCLSHGSTLEAGVESRSPGLESVYRPWSFEVSLYRGITRSDDREQAHRAMTPYAYVLTAAAALLIALSGWVAVRRGSRDGAVPTAARVAVVHSVYLAALIWMCRIAWSSAVESEGMVGRTLVFVGPRLDAVLAASFGVVFVMAFVGAYLANRRYSAASDFAAL